MMYFWNNRPTFKTRREGSNKPVTPYSYAQTSFKARHERAAWLAHASCRCPPKIGVPI